MRWVYLFQIALEKKMAVNPSQLGGALDEILDAYKVSFSEKTYSDENDDHDVLMDVFGIVPTLKRENRQYWGVNWACAGSVSLLKFVGNPERILGLH